MADAFIGEIRAFAVQYAPEDWLPCDGREIPVSQHQALHAVIGEGFGGVAGKTFRLPDLRGALAVGAGAGPGLTDRPLGQSWGSDTVALAITDIPAHQHGVEGRFIATITSHSNTPGRDMMLARTPGQADFANIDIDPVKVTVGLSEKAIGVTGAGQPHENRQPVLALNYFICADGDFPTQD